MPLMKTSDLNLYSFQNSCCCRMLMMLSSQFLLDSILSQGFFMGMISVPSSVNVYDCTAPGCCSSSGKYPCPHCILTPRATSLHLSSSVDGDCFSIGMCVHSTLYSHTVSVFPLADLFIIQAVFVLSYSDHIFQHS